MTNPETNKGNQAEVSEIPEIGTFFGLGSVKNTFLLKEGWANHNYLATTEDGREWVVKVLIEQEKESVDNDLAIQSQYVRSGVKTSTYQQSPNGSYVYESKIIATVSQKIEGEHPIPVMEDTSFAIGEVLAKFHNGVTSLPVQRNAWLSLEVTERLTSEEGNPLMKKARDFLSAGRHIYNKSLPKGIIHGDLCQENLLVNKENPSKIEAIFDFEEAEENLFIVDVARTMLAVCATDDGKKLNKSLINSFMKGYSSVRSLTSGEEESLPDAIKYAGGACMIWYIRNGFDEAAQNTISRVESLE